MSIVYNGDRTFVKILKEICAEEGIALTMTSYDWMGKVQKGEKTGFIWGYQLPENHASSHLICKDKSGVYDFLTAEGIPAVPHHLFLTPKETGYLGVTDNWGRMAELLARYGEVVVKPNEGTGGDLVLRAKNQGELERAVFSVFQEYRTLAISPFLEIENEYRVIVSGGKEKLVFAKQRPFVTGDGETSLSALASAKYPDRTFDVADYVPQNGERVILSWHHNLGKGAYARVVTDEEERKVPVRLALRAAKAVGIDFASVDVVKVGEEYFVLEINAGVMTERFSLESEENYATAKEIYREALLRYFSKGKESALPQQENKEKKGFFSRLFKR
ncbi:MAG: RimK-like protein [Clostridiales bacterium]|nr:RimK-like protein [Clostridiales bacterium]